MSKEDFVFDNTRDWKAISENLAVRIDRIETALKEFKAALIKADEDQRLAESKAAYYEAEYRKVLAAYNAQMGNSP